MRLFVDAYELSAYYFFLVYLARSKRPNTPHFVFKRIVRNFEVREMPGKLQYAVFPWVFQGSPIFQTRLTEPVSTKT